MAWWQSRPARKIFSPVPSRVFSETVPSCPVPLYFLIFASPSRPVLGRDGTNPTSRRSLISRPNQIAIRFYLPISRKLLIIDSSSTKPDRPRNLACEGRDTESTILTALIQTKNLPKHPHLLTCPHANTLTDRWGPNSNRHISATQSQALFLPTPTPDRCLKVT